MALGKSIRDIMKRVWGVQRVLLFPPQAYWRSCAALLGQVLETAFKDDFAVELLSAPEVPGRGAALCVSRFTLTNRQIPVASIFGQ